MGVESKYVNAAAYRLTKDAFLWERAEGLRQGGATKSLSVKMPERWAQLSLKAVILGNFERDFQVTEVTVGVGESDMFHSIGLSASALEVRDRYIDDFMSALEHFGEHDHSICLLRYSSATALAGIVTSGDILKDESELALEHRERQYAAGE